MHQFYESPPLGPRRHDGWKTNKKRELRQCWWKRRVNWQDVKKDGSEREYPESIVGVLTKERYFTQKIKIKQTQETQLFSEYSNYHY